MTPSEAHQLVASETSPQKIGGQRRSLRKSAGGANNNRPESPSSSSTLTSQASHLRPLLPFRDASIARSSYDLHLLDVLAGLKRAVDLGFYDPETFDVVDYEHRERVENGDTNWILPGKFMAFCGPHPRARVDVTGLPYHSPESYFDYFRSCHVKAIVRLNVAVYDARRFTEAGF